MNEISDKQALLITVKSSEYFSRFIDQIEQFENKFSNIEIWLGNLNIIQRKLVSVSSSLLIDRCFASLVRLCSRLLFSFSLLWFCCQLNQVNKHNSYE